MSEEWGPWIEHDGKGCPCVGMWIEFEAGDIAKRIVESRGEIKRVEGTQGWLAGDLRLRNVREVIRYRIRKPRGLTILEGLLENLPERVPA